MLVDDFVALRGARPNEKTKSHEEGGGDRDLAVSEKGGMAVWLLALGQTLIYAGCYYSFPALLPDYAVAGMPEALGYILCAVIGTALLVIFFKLAATLRRPHTDYGTPSTGC